MTSGALKEIGEFGLIERLAKGLKGNKSVIKGIGDDAAVLEWRKDKCLLATTDMLIEDVHFRLKDSPERIGWKAVCCGISDIAAMGGAPKWALVSCGLPRDLGVGYIEAVYKGIKKAAGEFGIDIVGGDTNASRKLILDVTILGEVRKKGVILRSGAKAGDYIFVTGSLGGSIYGRHLNFMPRLKESQTLVKNFKINSMIDISDGLSSDLSHILVQSGCGAVIYDYLIPTTKRRLLRRPDDSRGEAISIGQALSDGEDFELLFTMSKKEAFRLLDLRERLFDVSITRIGTVVDREFGAKIVDIFGRARDLKPSGFTHF